MSEKIDNKVSMIVDLRKSLQIANRKLMKQSQDITTLNSRISHLEKELEKKSILEEKLKSIKSNLRGLLK